MYDPADCGQELSVLGKRSRADELMILVDAAIAHCDPKKRQKTESDWRGLELWSDYFSDQNFVFNESFECNFSDKFFVSKLSGDPPVFRLSVLNSSPSTWQRTKDRPISLKQKPSDGILQQWKIDSCQVPDLDSFFHSQESSDDVETVSVTSTAIVSVVDERKLDHRISFLRNWESEIVWDSKPVVNGLLDDHDDKLEVDILDSEWNEFFNEKSQFHFNEEEDPFRLPVWLHILLFLNVSG